MADNTELNTGSGGDTIATDDIGGIKHQRVKIQYGTDGSATDVSDTNPLPIDDAGGSITVDGTVTANAGTGTFTVDGSGVTQPVSGTVTANLSATDNAVLDQIEVNTSYGDNTGGGTESGALRVTIANDSTGVLSVDDNGGSLTVDGAVSATQSGSWTVSTSGTTAVTQSGTWNINNVSGTVSLPTGASTSALQTTGNSSLSTIAGAVSGTEMQVDIVASLPAGTNAIGKLSANSGVDIGDVDVTSISAGSNLIGDVGISGARTSGGTTLYKNIDVDESEDQVKGTAGQVYWIHAINLKATPLYLKLYNATSASVTVGTTTPDLTFPVPSSGDTNGGGFTLSIPNGIAFSTAITIAATTGVADADSGAPGANELIVNLGYA